MSATYQKNNVEVHRIAAISYQIYLTENHEVPQTIYERKNPGIRPENAC
jgi:hypothetical protein